MTSPTSKIITKLMLSLYLCFFVVVKHYQLCLGGFVFFSTQMRPKWDSNSQPLYHCLLTAVLPSGLDACENLTGVLSGVIKLLALRYCWCWFWLVCWPKPIWHKLVDHATMQWTFNLATVQFSQFDLGQPPTTNDTQTKYMQLATRLCVRVPAAAQ